MIGVGDVGSSQDSKPTSSFSILLSQHCNQNYFLSVTQICFLSFCRESMWRHQVFWPRSCLCHPLQQLEVVLSASKNSRGDWGHPAQFCHPRMGPLFQTGDPVGDDETWSGFLHNCSRELSQGFWCHDNKTLNKRTSRHRHFFTLSEVFFFKKVFGL